MGRDGHVFLHGYQFVDACRNAVWDLDARHRRTDSGRNRLAAIGANLYWIALTTRMRTMLAVPARIALVLALSLSALACGGDDRSTGSDAADGAVLGHGSARGHRHDLPRRDAPSPFPIPDGFSIRPGLSRRERSSTLRAALHFSSASAA
jgi:hypothetical protein